MIAQFRQEKILETLQDKEVVYLKELASELGISESTIRRDIMKLEQDKNIESLRGGVIRLRNRRVDPPAVENQKTRMNVKHVIARKAAALVQEGDIIYIEAGSTTGAMLPYLQNKNITVVTSGLDVLRQLPIPGISCICIGGEVNVELASTCGPIAEKVLSVLYFDKAFISISAFSDTGIFANDIREARKREIVKEHASQTYVLGDLSKQQQWGFIQIMNRDECVLITEDDDPDGKSDQNESDGEELKKIEVRI